MEQSANYIAIIRESFEERYEKYLKDPEQAKQYMEVRLKYMPIEELAYLLATHDKFSRSICKEYENDISSIDPLGRKVDPWGRVIKNG